MTKSCQPGGRGVAEIGSQAEYARHAGISRQAVNKGVAAGTIPVRSDGKIDFAVADAVRKSGANPARLPEPEPVPDIPAMDAAAPVDGSFAAARTERERIAAERAAMDLARLKGELVSRAEVTDALITAGRTIRGKLDALTHIADEVVAICAAGGGARDVRQVIAERVKTLEQSIADALAKLGGEDEDG